MPAGKRCKGTRVTTSRQTKDRQVSYLDDIDLDSDEEGMKQNFNIEEKLASTKFPQYLRYFVKELSGDQVDLLYFQRTGFNTPILIREKSGLGIVVPDETFTVYDVTKHVGPRRLLDVMDCSTQLASQMTMKDWEDYYFQESTSESGEKKRVLNVISLEFSSTKLDSMVEAPKVVRQIDWVDNVWPRHLKEGQTEGTNDLREMKYPKVQKYCLMSVGGCYTDFHIDFGGTSVWYHILKGKKVFWLIPPTEANLKAYEQWTLSGKQGDVFFGDVVEKCGMITLEAGNTFFIPSGWIHAVYTPEDSLVFGGNFLHCFSIEKQIRVAQIEEITKVPQKHRFPFFTELQWFALDKYVFALLGRSHLELDDSEKKKLFGTENEQKQFFEALGKTPCITPQELFGLKAIIMYIHALPVSKKNVPLILRQPINLVRDVRVVVNDHKDDKMENAITGKPILYWPGIKNDHNPLHRRGGKGGGKKSIALKEELSPIKKEVKIETVVKQERVPCKVCQNCIRPNCGKCAACADMVQFGGLGTLRQICVMRRCLQPLLPIGVCCKICGLDGWFAEPNMRLVDRPPGTCALMECALCMEVTHPMCVTDYGVEGFIKMDLPNSWECPRCIKAIQDKKEKEKEEENIKEEQTSTGPDGQPLPPKIPKLEPPAPQDPLRRPISSGSDANVAGAYQLFSVKGHSDMPKSELRSQLSDQIISASSQPLKKPPYVFRPPPPNLSANDIWDRRRLYERNKQSILDKENGKQNGQNEESESNGTNYPKDGSYFDSSIEPVVLEKEPLIMLPIFQKLNTVDLSSCALVCKSWLSIVQDPSLWTSVKLDNMKITPHLLSLIVQRQPISLSLTCCQLGKQHLTWLLPRIPQTRAMSLIGLDYVSSVIALSTVNTPMLQELDLSFVTSLNDGALYKILSAPRDSRPGLLDKKSRLKLLKKLSLSGTEISDISLRYIAQYLHHLKSLKISGCYKISNDGIAQLSLPDTKLSEILTTLDISGCKQVNNQALQNLGKCKNLIYVDCTNTDINNEGIRKFIDESDEKLKVVAGSIICPKSNSSKKADMCC